MRRPPARPGLAQSRTPDRYGAAPGPGRGEHEALRRRANPEIPPPAKMRPARRSGAGLPRIDEQAGRRARRFGRPGRPWDFAAPSDAFFRLTRGPKLRSGLALKEGRNGLHDWTAWREKRRNSIPRATHPGGDQPFSQPMAARKSSPTRMKTPSASARSSSPCHMLPRAKTLRPSEPAVRPSRRTSSNRGVGRR